MATTITVENATPTASPDTGDVNATTSWQTLIEPPNYLAPVAGSSLGGNNQIRDGIAEVISPLFIANKAGQAHKVWVRITRANGTVITLLNGVDVEPNDVLPVGLNGKQFLNRSGVLNGAGDKLEIYAEANDAIDATISFTVGEAEPTDGA